MAEVDNSKSPSLSEQYLLKEKEEKSTTVANPVEETEVKASSTAPSEEDTPKTEETPVVESSEAVPATSEESSGASDSTTPEINEASPPVEAESENRDETPEIKLETAPADFRFPTTNQTRHCFTRYVEYHRCIAAKGEGAPECDKFAKYYRSLCPGEWSWLQIDRWNEQRENGTFPGPL
ncbi:cytochrome c oxidase subunit 6b-1-like isoform X2 [Solanum pennellii]|uniref:Cytochrome c oxidase subunit 6b-1-like isoform X2 n=1 Tax=Solanum pennellii TaxID=28526 RepID=A0ABM1FQG5_SOLPN|nr:cytochrome c oxidase subunit 6b-1-like isoform X2 [Solanum pennellii]